MKIIEIENITSVNELSLDGNDIELFIYFNSNINRWAMDIKNKTNNAQVSGIVLNTNEDVLTTAGKIGLQALVPVSFPEKGAECDLENFSTKVKLVYMSLEEYNEIRYDGKAIMRQQWLQ